MYRQMCDVCVRASDVCVIDSVVTSDDACATHCIDRMT